MHDKALMRYTYFISSEQAQSGFFRGLTQINIVLKDLQIYTCVLECLLVCLFRCEYKYKIIENLIKVPFFFSFFKRGGHTQCSLELIPDSEIIPGTVRGP